MRILVIGSGGREHAIGRKLLKSPRKPTLLFAPGNPGMAALGTCHPIPVDDIPALLELAKKEAVDLTVVGPEIPLVMGIADAFETEGLRIFGPTALAARLEGSKAFSKAFMARHGIPTAAFETFRDLESALTFLEKTGAPIVVKASGLAAGKGAVVCQTLPEARSAIASMLGPEAVFGESGSEVVIEEFMTGEEASVFAVCDGTNFLLLPTAQDHKRIFDGDLGPNTGGMGAYSPASIMTPELLGQTCREIIEPTLEGMRKEGHPYGGVLYVGVMITSQGPKVVEFNCRLGDPETQAVLPVYEDDLLEVLLAAVGNRLGDISPSQPRHYAAVVVLASGGYPDAYQNGFPIQGISESENIPGVQVIQAGTKFKDGALVTAGGRVLGVVGEAESLQQALHAAYEGIRHIHFEGMQYRRDIGLKGLTFLGSAPDSARLTNSMNSASSKVAG
jgi:phosphoribosylamine--glycine ligase